MTTEFERDTSFFAADEDYGVNYHLGHYPVGQRAILGAAQSLIMALVNAGEAGLDMALLGTDPRPASPTYGQPLWTRKRLHDLWEQLDGWDNLVWKSHEVAQPGELSHLRDRLRENWPAPAPDDDPNT